MYLVVGLGNPGSEYKNTRHNVGFDIIDLIAQKYNISVNRLKFKGMYGEGKYKGEKIILLKPQTYMNLSGESIVAISNFYKIPNEQIIVLYDDISLEVGRLRIRPKGSSGGHNGIKSIIAHLSSDIFPRIKIGVGKADANMISHVLGKFDKEDREKVEKIFQVAVDAVETIISSSVENAMNKYNAFVV